MRMRICDFQRPRGLGGDVYRSEGVRIAWFSAVKWLGSFELTDPSPPLPLPNRKMQSLTLIRALKVCLRVFPHFAQKLLIFRVELLKHTYEFMFFFVCLLFGAHRSIQDWNLNAIPVSIGWCVPCRLNCSAFLHSKWCFWIFLPAFMSDWMRENVMIVKLEMFLDGCNSTDGLFFFYWVTEISSLDIFCRFFIFGSGCRKHPVLSHHLVTIQYLRHGISSHRNEIQGTLPVSLSLSRKAFSALFDNTFLWYFWRAVEDRFSMIKFLCDGRRRREKKRKLSSCSSTWIFCATLIESSANSACHRLLRLVIGAPSLVAC